MENKICCKCGIEKPLDNFGRNKENKSGREGYCKPCKSEYSKAWNRRNLERHRDYQRRYRKLNTNNYKEKARNRMLKSLYGIGIDGYENLYRSQNGCCAICKGQNLDGKRLSVDHSHTTGTIRGLLCKKCNTGIGYFNDNDDLLKSAIEYLDKHKPKEFIQ